MNASTPSLLRDPADGGPLVLDVSEERDGRVCHLQMNACG